MCELCSSAPARAWSRRSFLGAAAALPLLAATGVQPGAVRVRQSDVFEDPLFGATINRRAAWAGSTRPPGEFQDEDVRFLLVHHTVDSNDYGPGDVIDRIQAIHRFHTGPEKNWPDVAYNFFVDRFGQIWEARDGSIEGAPRGSATGGNQGYSQLCAFIGDHQVEPPTAQAQAAMAQLLAWLAHRHDIEIGPGAETGELVSLGSNRIAAGERFSISTIAGHRQVSATACPGDATFALVTDEFPRAVAQLLQAGVGETPATSEPPASTEVRQPNTTVPATSVESTAPDPIVTSTTVGDAPSTTTETTASAPFTTADAAPGTTAPVIGEAAAGETSASGGGLNPVIPVAVVGAVAVAGGAVAVVRRDREPEPAGAGDEAGPSEPTESTRGSAPR